ncbi:MAG TPA: hypothetical protein VKQ54_03760 [Caulobacteraceae bacterium]|nr:hypothetical protein [Caulobacteraceae bacterium]
MMRIFSLLICDARYRVPTLALLETDDEQRAIELAKATLERSEFHRAVELRDAERAIYQRLRIA